MGQRRPEQVMVYVDLILGRSAISKFKFGIARSARIQSQGSTFGE